MHDRGDVMLGKGARQRGLVRDVAGNERAGDEAAVTGRKIVVDDRLIARRVQRPAAMRADIARTAGDENGRTIAHVSAPVACRLLLNSR